MISQTLELGIDRSAPDSRWRSYRSRWSRRTQQSRSTDRTRYQRSPFTPRGRWRL